MTSPGAVSATSADRLEMLNRRAQQSSLRGAWQREGTREPEIRPWVWRWEEVSSCLLEAGALVPISDAMRMRTIGLVNPSRPSPYGTTRTITFSLQHLNPEEDTESHRHTRTSLYFMVQGKGVFTTAEGELQPMEPGDLLIQPSWTWHGSKNSGDEPAIWITVQDTGLVNTLDAEFREQYPEGRVQPAIRADGYHLRRFGLLRPKAAEELGPAVPVRYPWQDTLRTLEEMAAAGEKDPHDGVALEYSNPVAGGPTTRTMTCGVQWLPPGGATRPHRHTSSTLYFVVQGQGVLEAGRRKGDPEALEWGPRDSFFVPPWHWHLFRIGSATEPAILFSVSDRPLLEMTGLHREERG